MTNELIIQLQCGPDRLSCEAFNGVPSERAGYLAIVHTNSNEAEQQALLLKKAIVESLQHLAPSVQRFQPECNGMTMPFMECKAIATPSTQKLLVIVGDNASPDILISNIDRYWPLPVLPVYNVRQSVNLHSPFNAVNATFWSQHISEVVPYILSILGITAEESRIFISYKREDALEIGEQLHDELCHNGFRVFLDRFTVPPGINFQRRLYQELADKAMILVLETPELSKSKWVGYELKFARKYRLGQAALNFDGSPKLKQIDEEYRLSLAHSDLSAALKSKDKVLTADALFLCVNFIKEKHGRAMMIKRHTMINNLRAALLSSGCSVTPDDWGFLYSSSCETQPKEYKVLSLPRPASVEDFLKTDKLVSGQIKKIILSPKLHEPLRKEIADWLSQKSQINLVPEQLLLRVARQIANGTL